MLTEDKFRKTLNIERGLYTDDSGFGPATKEPRHGMPMNWLVIVLIIAVALMLFLSDRIPLLFLLLVGSLVANYSCVALYEAMGRRGMNDTAATSTDCGVTGRSA